MDENFDLKKSFRTLFSNLRIWNGFMGLLHLIQGVLMWVLSKEFLQDVFWNLPKPVIPEGGFEELRESGRRAGIVFENEKWFSINLGQAIACFLLLSALFHFIIILPKIYPWYLKNIKKEINYLRWFEYALSSSLMIFVIAMLCNINNAAILIPIIAINACMNFFGASMEMHNSTLKLNSSPTVEVKSTFDQEGNLINQEEKMTSTFKTNWLHFIFGCFAGAIPWVVMGVYFFTSLDRLGDIEELPERVKDILKLVKFIFPALFVFFNCFAINMFLQYKKIGPWKNYLFGERVYILLSLVAKSFLAWFIWGGTLRN
ncbi:MAG: heliorhodopsin HeR [Patescibacteria group bacterium]